MNIINNKMWNLIFQKITSTRKRDLSPELQEIIDGGFLLEQNCYFLKNLRRQQSHIRSIDFIDKTGFECFVNSIHIDDYTKRNIFEQALLFSEKVIELWKQLNYNLRLKVMINSTDFGFNIKFHAVRENEVWINDSELDVFNEALMVVYSN